MKITELQKLIREEVRKVVNESKPYFKYVDKELYPNPGMEVNARDIDNEMMIYFIKKNFKLLITTKNEKDILGSITKQNNNYQFLKTGGSNSSTSDEINKKDILSIKIVRESLNEGRQIQKGSFVRYKKDKDFTGGKILSIKGSKVEIHNWDGSTTELPLKDLEYIESWNR